jgi:hypothetical protein
VIELIESSTKFYHGERMTRDELKELVKECLLEIVIEGSPKRVVESVRERNTTKQAAKPAVTRPALDLIHPRGKPASHAAPARTPERPRPSAAQYKDLVGGNDVLASVFADTAASGLVERLGSPDGSAPQANPMIDTGVDPTLFEGSDNWAMMAFSESRNTSRR